MTGIRLPDAKMDRVKTISDLQQALLAGSLDKETEMAQKRRFTALPNVNFKDKKVNKMDKDEARGRWKLIATALEERGCLLYTSPSPRDGLLSRMPSSA